MKTPTTAEMVEGWWRSSSKVKPYPDLGSCAALAAQIDLTCRNSGRLHKRLPERKVSNALDTLRAQIPLAETFWREALARNDGTISSIDAPFVLSKIADLQSALHIPADWLLDPLVVVTDLGWQVDAKFLYPKVVASWVHAGHEQAKPHATSPACCFLEKAIAHLGWRKNGRIHTAGSIGKMLWEAGILAVDVPQPPSRIIFGECEG